MKTLFLSAFVAIGLAGCQTTPSEGTASRRPEATTTASVEHVKSAAATVAVNNGFTIVSSDPINMAFDKEAPLGAQLFLGNSSGSSVKHRFKVTTIDIGNHRRIIGSVFLITPGAWGRTNIEEIFNSNEKLNAFVQEIKRQAEIFAVTQ
jgi:hypothetical protein